MFLPVVSHWSESLPNIQELSQWGRTGYRAPKHDIWGIYMKKAVISLYLLLQIFLTACGAHDAAQNILQNVEAKKNDTVSLVDTTELPVGQCYCQTPYLNPVGISQPEGQCIWNSRVYSFSNAPTKLSVVDANGNSQSLDIPDAPYLYSVCDAGNTLALLAGSYPVFFSGADDQLAQAASDGSYAIYLYNEAGALSGNIPLEGICTDTPYEFGSDGTDFYLLFGDSVVRVGPDGQQLAKSDRVDGRLLQLVCCDGAVYLRVEGNTIYQAEKIVRLSADTLQQEESLSCAALKIQGMGNAADDTLLLSSSEYLLRPDFSTGTMTAILRWADNASTSVNNYSCILETASGFYAYGSSVDTACFYEKLPDGETLEEPIELTLFVDSGATFQIEIAARDFQKLYPQYRVNITSAETREELDLALTEFGAGKGYDMYMLSESQWIQLNDAAQFENLSRWMESDSTKPLARIRPSVWKQIQKDGSIYRLPLSYTVLAYAADPEQLPDCTPETVLRVCEEKDETLYPFAFNSDYSANMAKRCAQDYVDIVAGTCNFICDSFYAQLALLQRQQAALETLPENIDASGVCDGLLYHYLISSADTIIYQPERYMYPRLAQHVYYGYPSDYGSRCQLNFGSLLAINNQSDQKAGAWAFLSYLLSDTYQQGIDCLPVNDVVLQEQLAQLLTQEKVTQSDIDTFYALVDYAQPTDYPTEPVEQIILEEASAYLAGAIDATTTAERIQSRVFLYIQEQKVE